MKVQGEMVVPRYQASEWDDEPQNDIWNCSDSSQVQNFHSHTVRSHVASSLLSSKIHST